MTVTTLLLSCPTTDQTVHNFLNASPLPNEYAGDAAAAAAVPPPPPGVTNTEPLRLTCTLGALPPPAKRTAVGVDVTAGDDAAPNRSALLAVAALRGGGAAEAAAPPPSSTSGEPSAAEPGAAGD